MKKFYENAEMEIIKFQNEDIITASNVDLPEPPSDPIEVPGDEF